MTTTPPTLFDTPAASRRTDPPSSRAAAERVTKSGKASTQREQILAALKQHPGSTAAEIAALAGMERHDPSRRLPELRGAGLVVNGPERVCRVTGSPSLTWLPAEPQPRSSAIPSVITPAMLDAIHAAFDRQPLTGQEILANHARSRARRIPNVIEGTVSAGAGRTALARAGDGPAAARAQTPAAAVRLPLRPNRTNRGKN